LPLSEKTDEYAKDVAARLRLHGFRVGTNLHSARVQAKIREAQLELIPYMLVVGPREAEQGAVAVRCRIDGDLGVMSFDDAVARLTAERDERVIRQIVKSSFSAADDDSAESSEY
jgi:threonyl-tRNA synthetase